jgi:tetratricopeptide (TPR) repeat protein
LGHVRRDILNGWKEIGGYVSRDIRTVERWEKQRGLPVRRVPGAGRATVYALTSELDEWLESTRSEDPQKSALVLKGSSSDASPAIGATRSANRCPQANAIDVDAAGSISPKASDYIAANSAAASSGPVVDVSLRGLFPTEHGRQRWIAASTIAVAAGLLCLLVSPVIRSHAKSISQAAPHRMAISEDTPRSPYRSPVPGVDDLYLRGIYSYEQRTPESLQRSLEDFSAASAKDPSYAPAYAGLANTYNLLREYSVMPDAEAYPKARQAAEHAIALDPSLPEAHASLGFIDFFWYWDGVSAEHEFHRALALNPNSVLAHHWYGSMLMHQGRLSEAIEQLNTAQRLEPTSAAVLSTRALAIGLDGHRGEAVDMLQDIINVTPGVSSPHAILATLSAVEPRDPARYLIEMKRSAELRHASEPLEVATEAADAYGAGGERRMWTTILATEERLHPGATNRTYLMAESEAALGRNDTAIADLTELAAQHDSAMIGIAIDPTLVPLHRDQRFVRLVATVGLPPTTH